MRPEKKEEMVWESVAESFADHLERMALPNGWLYRNRIDSSEDTLAVGLCFVPSEKNKEKS